MTVFTPVLWFYAVTASLVFGASMYETWVVHPAWSRKPPDSFRVFMGEPSKIARHDDAILPEQKMGQRKTRMDASVNQFEPRFSRLLEAGYLAPCELRHFPTLS